MMSENATRIVERRQQLGQFFTPEPVADFMASLFDANWEEVQLLDAGAGNGALTAGLVRRLCGLRTKPYRIHVTAFEIDEGIIPSLQATMGDCRRACRASGIDFEALVLNEDFIASSVPAVNRDLFAAQLPPFNAAIVNPPYRKIRSDSVERQLLRSAGIETSNLYTGFLSLIVRLLARQGELVSITPRSFCNGPYFKPFRRELLDSVSLKRLHLFESRSAAFSADEVLQENVIVHAVKSASVPESIVISSSSGDAAAELTRHVLTYDKVVFPNDPEKFIHLVLDEDQVNVREAMTRLSVSLAQLGLSISTGRVVDFRARAYLRKEPGGGTVPLIYPCHFNAGFVDWPKDNSRKPNAIVRGEATEDLLVPSGVYVLTKRFSAKEEKRRIVACIFDPGRIESAAVGFENHLNYFHIGGQGLPMTIAKGLATFLNSTLVDRYFRQFNGHTQVNATDLRNLTYPTKEELERLGRKVGDFQLNQAELDSLVDGELGVKR